MSKKIQMLVLENEQELRLLLLKTTQTTNAVVTITTLASE